VRWDGFATPRMRKGMLFPWQRAIANFSPEYPKNFGSRIGQLRNHSSPAEIREAIGTEMWGSFGKVTCIRNPFSLMVSRHFFMSARDGLEKKDVDNESAFTASVLKHIERDEWEVNLPDFVDSSWSLIRQESLESDFLGLTHQWGVSPGPTLNFKSEYRPRENRDYKYLYSKETRELVSSRYSKWLEAFDYDF
jgi:hypothetical protein